MAYQPYLIAPYDQGLDKSQEPWLVPESAFSVMNNCFLHNGYVKRRLGKRLLGRLQKQITGISMSGSAKNWTYTCSNVPVAPSTVKIYDGAALLGTDNGSGVFAASATVTSGTVNYLTGAVSIVLVATPGATPTISYDYYPLQPVMGILQRETIYENREITVVFDKNDAYEFNGTNFATTTTANQSWTGDDYNFFWGCSYYYDGSANKLFWVTNNKNYSLSGSDNRDGIKYYNGTSWVTLNPLITAADRLQGCLCLIAFKGRLIAFRTIETSSNVTQYQRARWCQPNAAPTGTDAWRSDLIGYGGYVDAATGENIVSVEIIHDRCIVYFEKSIWELFYTGIKEQPFTFRRISDDYGCESTFSVVEGEGLAYAVGLNGITATDGNSVKKIDKKLDFDLFAVKNTSTAKLRVHGIQDDLYKMLYWTLPYEGSLSTQIYPSKMLAYNYENGSFSYFDDSFTVLGKFQPTSNYSWSTLGQKWSEIGKRWSDLISDGDVYQIVGGNAQGFVQQFDFYTLDDACLHIAGVTIGTDDLTISSVNHMLSLDSGQNVYVKLNNVCGVTATFNGAATTFANLTFKVSAIVDADSFKVGFPSQKDDGTTGSTTFSGTYTGGGTVTRLFNFNLTTKKFNPLVKEGSQLKIGYADLYTGSTSNGQINVGIIVDDVDYEPPSTRYVKEITDFPLSKQYGTSNVSKQWNRILINARGQFLQLQLSLNETQMLTSSYRDVVFELHAMNLWLAKSGKWIGLK